MLVCGEVLSVHRGCLGKGDGVSRAVIGPHESQKLLHLSEGLGVKCM